MNLNAGSRWAQAWGKVLSQLVYLRKSLWPAVRGKFSAYRQLRLAALLLGSVLLVLTGYAWVHKTVYVYDGGKQTVCETLGMTVGDVLEEQGIRLNKDDVVKPGMNAKLSEGQEIRILRAVPVKIVVDGREIPWTTRQLTVEKVLEEAKISLSPYDRVGQKLKQAVKPQMEIRVYRVTNEIQVVHVPYPYNTRRILDDHLERGMTRVVQKGQEGVKERKIQLTYEDGILIGQKVISEEIVAPPKEEVIAIGDLGVISRGGREIRFRKAMVMTATAYDPGPASCGPYATGRTSIGMKAQKGIVAVDPRVIPLHSRLYIDGYGFAIAGDTGGSIKGKRIDLCFNTYNEARRFGRKQVKVYILE